MTTRPITEDERIERACDWSDFRKDYGGSADAQIRSLEHSAFLAGWDAARIVTEHKIMPTEADS